MCKKLYITFILLFLSIFIFGQTDTLGLKKCILSPDQYNGQPFYIKVDIMPEYKGGMNELMQLIAKKVIFTDREPNRNSIIHTTFVIDTFGQIQNICIITNRTVLNEQESQIIDIFRNAPNWTPGILNNKKVCVRMTIPVRLCLK